MTRFYITPDKPTEDLDYGKDQSLLSALKIDPEWYKEQIQRQWIETTFYQPTKNSLLYWISEYKHHSGYKAHFIGTLSSNMQWISVGDPNYDFFVWHRNIIDSKYRLFLWNESEWINNIFELKSNVTVDDLEKAFGKLFRPDTGAI